MFITTNILFEIMNMLFKIINILFEIMNILVLNYKHNVKIIRNVWHIEHFVMRFKFNVFDFEMIAIVLHYKEMVSSESLTCLYKVYNVYIRFIMLI